jgi:hypothetical protein
MEKEINQDLFETKTRNLLSPIIALLFGDHVVFMFLLHRRGLNSKPGGGCIAATGAFSSISLLLTTYGRLKDYIFTAFLD